MKARKALAGALLSFVLLAGGVVAAQEDGATEDGTTTSTTHATSEADAASEAAATSDESSTSEGATSSDAPASSETSATTAPAPTEASTDDSSAGDSSTSDPTSTGAPTTDGSTTTTAAPTTDETTTTTTEAATVAVTASLVDPATCKVADTVQLRDYGPQVECVEAALVAKGHTLAGPNLYYDYSTFLAVQAFQQANGLVADGVAGPATLYALGVWAGGSAPANCGVATTLQVRDLSNDVLCLEGALVKRGYTLAGPNLYFDYSTVLAVQAFQRANGLAVDGIAGPATLRALGIYTGTTPTTPPPPPPPPPPPAGSCKVTTTVQVRDYGNDVLCLEQALVRLGYGLAGPNLYFDYSTVLAVQAFQRAKGHVADGIAGPITLHSLGIWGGAPPSLHGLPANSGTGRRVVYHRGQQRVWAVDAAGNVIKTHRVSGRLYEPYKGTYSVYSRSLYTYSTDNPNVKWRYMVRFAYGPNGGRIGFHEIPKKFGVPLQSEAQLGQPLSGGCVRQSTADAQWMWNWAGIGTKVVVI